MPDLNLKAMSISNLFRTHSKIMDELRRRGIIRSYNNPVSDYTEWLVSSRMNLDLSRKSQAGYDAIGSNGLRYQIKGRRNTALNKSTQLGVIRNLSEKKFDFLIGVIFNSDYSVAYAALIPQNMIAELSHYSEHQNGNILHLRKKILEVDGVEDITERLIV